MPCDDLGGTPLHDAAEHGQLEVCINNMKYIPNRKKISNVIKII